MSLTRIYYDQVSLDDIDITDKEIIHKIRDVLRLGRGKEVALFNGKGKEYSFVIEEVSKKILSLKQARLRRDEEEPLKKVILAFPLVKEEKVDFILQKATELGVWGFQPFCCQRSLSLEISQKKQIRWQKIVIEATRQSQRLWLPQVFPAISFQELIESDIAARYVARIDGPAIEKIIFPTTGLFLLVVGPTGDFTIDEYQLLEVNNFSPLKLCDTLLRTETAAIYGVGLLVNIVHNL